MVYLDNGATTFHKPAAVRQAMISALDRCSNPGRGGYTSAMAAAETVYSCRETAGRMFHCDPEQVVFTSNCTHGLNIAIRTLVKPGSKVVISGFEHNAVTRPLRALNAQVMVAGRKLFDWENMLTEFERYLQQGVDAAIFTHVSNVFGYILPVEQMGALCKKYAVPFAIDAAQSAGALEIDLTRWGADFVAMPGHKGLLGPQGTGLLLCGKEPDPLIYGGTGSQSVLQEMPDFLPDRAEAGTVNVPGIAGLNAGMKYVDRMGVHRILYREQLQVAACVDGLQKLGFHVFSGEHQAATVSFVTEGDCEEVATFLADHGIAVRAGLHCAPLAHQSAATAESGTVRISYGHDANPAQTTFLLKTLKQMR